MPRLLAVAALFALAAPAVAGPRVVVVVGPNAPKLERFAADELAGQLKQLFDVEAVVGDKPPASADHVVLVGGPTTNPSVSVAVGDRWPKLSEQGHVLRGTGKTLVVGGGSPVATLWAVYELGHRFGVRSFLHGDVMPEKVPELSFDGIDVTLEPTVKVRAWRVLDDDPIGYGGWGLADHRQLLRQLAKLKFNRVVPGPGPAALKPFPVSGDTPGRKTFMGSKVFDNPDLTGKPDRAAAAAALARAVADAAAEFGLAVGEPAEKLRPVSLRGFLPHVPADLPTDGGFLIDPEVPGDLSPTAYLLARRAFGPKPTAKDAQAEMLTPVLGPLATERVQLGFRLIDEAAALVAKNDPAFAELSPELIVRQLKSADAPPAWWKEAGKLYAGGMDEMYRGIRATFHDPARPTLLYYAKRCEFAVHYFAAVEAARLAGVAKAAGDKAATVTHLEKATESMYSAGNALGDVARDPSDRGLIAALAEYAYRPLKAELKAAEKK